MELTYWYDRGIFTLHFNCSFVSPQCHNKKLYIFIITFFYKIIKYYIAVLKHFELRNHELRGYKRL